MSGLLSPLQAYLRAERQKQRLGAAFRAKILRLHQALSTHGADAARAPHGAARRTWREASRRFAEVPAGDPGAVIAAYGDLVMQLGLLRIEPSSRQFRRQLRGFHRNYVTNFPLPEEQESLEGFRDLWRASPRAGGYQEVGYSVLCPLTGRYLMGINFTIQPRSDTVHFIYGFVNPIARGFGGCSTRLIALMREAGRREIAAHLAAHPADRPGFHSAEGPLILFEKNILDAMSLTEILMDTARIDIDRPPRRGTRLSASAISQSLRDFIWDRRGGRIIDYNYMQSSLDGVVRLPPDAREAVIALLNRTAQTPAAQRRASDLLTRCLGDRLPGCVTLDLCAFVTPGRTSVPTAQIQLSNEIFQGISVVKDVDHLDEDIYFQAQMASLVAHSRDGAVGLRPILPSGATDFQQAEQLTKALLSRLSWAQLRAGRDRPYGIWLQEAGVPTPDAR